MLNLTLPVAPGFVTSGEGGLQFRDVKASLATVTDNGVDPDDSRVMLRTNQATKIVLDHMVPVGGMSLVLVRAVQGFLALPPTLENIIDVQAADDATKIFGSNDTTQGWFETVSNSVYLDPEQQHDNPLIDYGLRPDASDPSILRRTYLFPGLEPSNANVWVTGARRYLPITSDDDYPIVQNIEALRLIIISIERYENSQPDEGQKYRQQGFEMLQAEAKK